LSKPKLVKSCRAEEEELEGGRRGRGGAVYKAGSERVTTHMDVAGGYVKEIWLGSWWVMG
jgi:hypothetical protein